MSVELIFILFIYVMYYKQLNIYIFLNPKQKRGEILGLYGVAMHEMARDAFCGHVQLMQSVSSSLYNALGSNFTHKLLVN